MLYSFYKQEVNFVEQIIDFLAEKEILILCSVIALVVLVCLFIFIHETYEKLKEKSKLKQNTQELNQLVEQVQQELKKEKCCDN